MLNMRRRGAALAREEFKAVAAMSWFDETLQFNTPIVQTLKATATSPADRLALVGRAVGMTPAPRSRELFELAELMSLVLRTSRAACSRPRPWWPISTRLRRWRTTMNRIIDLWQSATGERVKDRRQIGNRRRRRCARIAAAAHPGASQPLTLARPVASDGNRRPAMSSPWAESTFEDLAETRRCEAPYGESPQSEWDSPFAPAGKEAFADAGEYGQELYAFDGSGEDEWESPFTEPSPPRRKCWSVRPNSRPPAAT